MPDLDALWSEAERHANDLAAIARERELLDARERRTASLLFMAKGRYEAYPIDPITGDVS